MASTHSRSQPCGTTASSLSDPAHAIQAKPQANGLEPTGPRACRSGAAALGLPPGEQQALTGQIAEEVSEPKPDHPRLKALGGRRGQLVRQP